MPRDLVAVIALAAGALGCGHPCYSPKSPPSSYAGVAQGLEKGCSCDVSTAAPVCVATVDGASALNLTCGGGRWMVSGFCNRGLAAEPGEDAGDETE